MLPGGVLTESLAQMWGESYETLIDVLKVLGVLDSCYNSDEESSLCKIKEVMKESAATTIKNEDKMKFNDKIADYYEDMLLNYYRAGINASSKDIKILDLQNINLEMCIKRLATNKRSSNMTQEFRPPSINSPECGRVSSELQDQDQEQNSNPLVRKKTKLEVVPEDEDASEILSDNTVVQRTDEIM